MTCMYHLFILLFCFFHSLLHKSGYKGKKANNIHWLLTGFVYSGSRHFSIFLFSSLDLSFISLWCMIVLTIHYYVSHWNEESKGQFNINLSSQHKTQSLGLSNTFMKCFPAFYIKFQDTWLEFVVTLLLRLRLTTMMTQQAPLNYYVYWRTLPQPVILVSVWYFLFN